MFEWDDKYSVNVSIIDKEHKKLIDIINKAIVAKQYNNNSKEVLEIVDEMIEYALKHFANEETYMKKFNYPEYQFHRNEHNDFTNKTIAYQNKVFSGDYEIIDEIFKYLQQ